MVKSSLRVVKDPTVCFHPLRSSRAINRIGISVWTSAAYIIPPHRQRLHFLAACGVRGDLSLALGLTHPGPLLLHLFPDGAPYPVDLMEGGRTNSRRGLIADVDESVFKRVTEILVRFKSWRRD